MYVCRYLFAVVCVQSALRVAMLSVLLDGHTSEADPGGGPPPPPPSGLNMRETKGLTARLAHVTTVTQRTSLYMNGRTHFDLK